MAVWEDGGSNPASYPIKCLFQLTLTFAQGANQEDCQEEFFGLQLRATASPKEDHANALSNTIARIVPKKNTKSHQLAGSTFPGI